MRIAAVTLISILAFAACGEKPRPQKPFILTDRASVGFNQEFGGGTFIGTKPQQSLSISNEGIEDLVISEITKSGDGAFTMMAEKALPTTVPGAQRSYVQIYFEPTEAKDYAGKITITSNADNYKTLEIGLSGRGIVPPTNDGG